MLQPVLALLKYLAHRLRELPLHVSRIFNVNRNESIVILPSATDKVASSRERAYHLGLHLKRLGWRVVVVPPQLELSQRRRIIRFEQPKVILIQQARHTLNRPTLYKAKLIVFDMDDADFFDSRQTEIINDCCRDSDLVLAGSKFVAEYCRKFNSNVHVQWTGMDMRNVDFSPPSKRANIVAWGTSGALAYCAERQFIAAIAKSLIKRVHFDLWVYGANSHPDLTRFADELAIHGVKVRFIPPMSFEDYHKSLEHCAVGLHPVAIESPFSRGKSFGKLNSYMLMGVPVVVQDALDYPEFFIDKQNGMLAAGIEDWAEKIYEILDKPVLRDRLADQARLDFERLLSTKSVAKNVDKLLTDYLYTV